MKPFNNQFATQRLRENTVKFTINNDKMYSAVMDRFMISDKGDYLETDLNTFQRIEDLAQSMGFESGTDYNYEVESDYMKHRKDPEYYEKEFQKTGTSDYFKRRELDEEGSVTGTGATFTPGTGEQYATPKAFKKKNEEKDVEPKLAAGKAKVYMKDKWGWKEAPSIPNRPSKGGFIYKQLFEAEVKDSGTLSRDGKDMIYIDTESGRFMYEPTPEEYQAFVLSGSKVRNLLSKGWLTSAEPHKPLSPGGYGLGMGKGHHIDENYARFKNETKIKTESQQIHAAMRLAEKKLAEVNRILEYTTQLRTELSETKYSSHTKKVMESMVKRVAEAYKKIKSLK